MIMIACLQKLSITILFTPYFFDYDYDYDYINQFL